MARLIGFDSADDDADDDQWLVSDSFTTDGARVIDRSAISMPPPDFRWMETSLSDSLPVDRCPTTFMWLPRGLLTYGSNGQSRAAKGLGKRRCVVLVLWSSSRGSGETIVPRERCSTEPVAFFTTDE